MAIALWGATAHAQTTASPDLPDPLRPVSGCAASLLQEGWKQALQDIGIDACLPVILSPQWGTSPGGKANIGFQITPTIVWTPFHDTEYGSGAFRVAYIQQQYLTKPNGAVLQRNLGLLAPVAVYPSNRFEWSEVTYTHTAPGDRIAVTVGQFALSNLDSNEFTNAQFGSQTYPSAGLGGYVTVKPTDEISLAAGIQNASNLGGDIITANGIARGEYLSFLYMLWKGTPVAGWGKAQYNLVLYNQPSVAAAPSRSGGASFNAVQHFDDDWAAYFLANLASGNVTPIRSTVAGGIVRMNPFGRNEQDQLLLGFGWNQTNKAAFSGQAVRRSESMGEISYTFTVANGLQIVPDIQVFFNPALRTNAGPAGVFTIRAMANF